MARHPIASLQTVRPKGSVTLRSYGTDKPVAAPEVLRVPLAVDTDAQRTYRQRFGRSISMDRIEQALRQAYRGSMQDITDLSRETIDTDPHLASVLNKRFRALAGLPWEIHPASGTGVDVEKAKFYAEAVREQLAAMEGFRRLLFQQAWAIFDNRACNELHWIEVPPGTGMSSPYGTVRYAVEKAGWIHPRRLSYGPKRNLQIVDEASINVFSNNFAAAGIPVDALPYKFVQWTPQFFGEYPEREGLAQRCMYWSFFKRFSARERMILTELFGKPWRVIKVSEESNAQEEDLKNADAVVDALGGSFTARLPRGVDLDVHSPSRSAGQVHQEVITESDRQISKLVLGQTGTTDGVPAGLNSNQANVMQDEQLMILQTDAAMMSENIESQLIDAIIAVNFGPNEVNHAPKFVLRSDLPADRKTEIERLQAALDSGLAIDIHEAYEVSGFSQPADEATVLRIEQPPTPPNSPVAPAPRPVTVYRPGQSPEAGEQQPPPAQAAQQAGSEDPNAQVGAADAAKTITVNEDRKARGLEPLTLPDGSEDPDGYLTIEEFNAKRQTPEPTQPAAPPSSGAEEDDDEDDEDDDSMTPNLAGPVNVAAVKKMAARASASGDEVMAHNASVLLRMVKGQSAEEVFDPYAGQGGLHTHGIDRQLKTTAVDGEHQHVFLLPDGRLMLTEFDGSHQHTFADEHADTIGTGGEHMHQIIVDGMTGQTGFERSAHTHVLQVFETGLDGPHTHVLKIRNPVSGIDTEITSLTPGQFAAYLAEQQRVEVVDPNAPSQNNQLPGALPPGAPAPAGPVAVPQISDDQ